MLHMYAIEPDALAASWDKCRHLLDLMGFEDGRAIAPYPNEQRWMRMIRDACDKNSVLGARNRHRILEMVVESNVKLVRSGVPDGYDDEILPVEERWVRNAVARQADARAFHAILATRNPNGHRDVVLEEEVKKSHPKLDVPREEPVLREPEAFAAHVGALVRNSRELLLIDPHFDPSKNRWWPVVRACIDLAPAPAARDDSNVTIHTLDTDRKPGREEFQRRCQQYYPRYVPDSATSIRICRWRPHDDRPHDFHARYLLTDRGGYKVDKGFDEEPGIEHPVGLLPDREWKRLYDGFGDDAPFFEKEPDGDFTVRPGR